MFSGNTKEGSASEKYRTQTKIAIVNKLLDINGSMKEFAEGIEAKLAFNGRMRYSTSSPRVIAFDHGKRESVEGRMRNFLMQMKGVRKL